MNIIYQDNHPELTAGHLEGFFVDWPSKPSPATLLKCIQGSTHSIVARDESGKVVGFITAITDGALSAYIPLLEVLPECKGQGIGKELVTRMMEKLNPFYMVDLVCDSDVVPFYEKFDLQKLTAMGKRTHSNIQ